MKLEADKAFIILEEARRVLTDACERSTYNLAMNDGADQYQPNMNDDQPEFEDEDDGRRQWWESEVC